jgi:hypothetical protein
MYETGEIDEDTGKLYYVNKYLKGLTLTLEQGSKGWRAGAASPIPSPFRCKVGRQKEATFRFAL